MRIGSRLIIGVLAAALLAAALAPFISPQSGNPCASCHGNYFQYLDILEGDPGNQLPTIINDGETLTVAVVVKNICNAATENTLSSISATLSSQNGHFKVANPTYSMGSLSPGRTGKAQWQITVVSAGTDTMVITANARNTHYNCQFADSYSPSPTIAVNKTVVNLPPSVFLTAPAAGFRLTGGTDRLISWSASDEDKPSCLVSLYYSTDDFAGVNESIAAGIPAPQTYTWSLPLIDSSTVRLKATIVDSKGLFNESQMAGSFTIDSTAPQATSFQPADGEKNASDSAILVVKFSEPVVKSSAQQAFGISPDPGGVVWSWNSDQTAMTAIHSPFAPGTKYTCTMSSGTKDLSVPGNVGQTVFSWSFHTPAVIIPVPSIVLSSPPDGGMYYWGESIQARWTASGGTGVLAVNLSISENDTAGPFIPVANGIANMGNYSYNAPKLVSETCLIEASVYDQNGMESKSISGLFSIAQNLLLEASFPSGEEAILAGNATEVFWNSTGGHGAVAIALYFQPDGNSSPQLIASGLPRSGGRMWTAPELNSNEALLFLNATDEWGRSEEMSSSLLTIKTKVPPPPPPPPPRENRPPAVMFSIGEGEVLEKSLVTFDASGSFDPDGDSLYYIWDFGDGTGILNTTTPTLTHVFLDPAEYTVQLVVGDGQNETLQVMIVLVDALPELVIGRGDDWAVISLGIVIMIVGSVGVVYAAIGRPRTRPPAAPPGQARTDAATTTAGPDPESAAIAQPSKSEASSSGTPHPTPDSPALSPGGPAPFYQTSAPASDPSAAASETTFIDYSCVPFQSGATLGPATASYACYPKGSAPLLFDREKCVGCGGCSRRCSSKAINMVDKKPMVVGQKCNGCGECVKKCVKGAISHHPSFPVQKGG